jgi:wobble nucleotide-excising tRNase
VINKIKLLRNIGQFESADGAKNIDLGRLTLVYSENGRGKTTLAAILRSLATGDPVPIAERRRLRAQNPPHVVLDCGGPPPVVFEAGSWNRVLPDIVIFDDVFIDQNVHSGLSVSPNQRQKLHEWILGSKAVELSKRLDGLVSKIEAHNASIRIKLAAIPSALRGPFSIDDFCSLPLRTDIDEIILETERALAAAQDHDAIRATPHFEVLSLPEFDIPGYEQLLKQDLPALSSATLLSIQEHMATLGRGGESWVAEGMRRIPLGSESCPFCAQGLSHSPMIEHYRQYFSAAYADLRSAISSAIELVAETHSGDAVAAFERDVRIVFERRHFWSRFCEVPDVAIDTAALVRDWKAARQAVEAHLTSKQSAPLEPTRVSDATQALIAVYESHRNTIRSINKQLATANSAIGVAKERAATADSRVLASDLAKSRAMKARHEPAMSILCAEYLQERTAKGATEAERDQAKADLQAHRANVFPGYQAAINVYLQKFNAEFRLDNVTYVDTRGGATCTYNVLINNTPVAIGGADPTPGSPSFRNTLSAGDRNTLALAFFFASLDQDQMLAERLVVIDDPISSLDDHRTLTTAQECRKLAQRASQVIVLSHSKPFLCGLWEGTDSSVRAALEVGRDATGSSLLAWNVTDDAITEHDRRHATLGGFVDSGAGDKRGVASDIRPHLEAFLRVACPESFPPGTLLGPFLNVCRQRLGAAGQILGSTAIQELAELVEYANKFHHDTNPAWETEDINSGELNGYVKRTLKFTRPLSP